MMVYDGICQNCSHTELLCCLIFSSLFVHRILHHSWILLCFSLEELPSKLRGLVRSTKKVEADIAALKISYLKKINKGSNIVIMDSWVLIPLLSHYITKSGTKVNRSKSMNVQLLWFSETSGENINKSGVQQLLGGSWRVFGKQRVVTESTRNRYIQLLFGGGSVTIPGYPCSC